MRAANVLHECALHGCGPPVWCCGLALLCEGQSMLRPGGDLQASAALKKDPIHAAGGGHIHAA